MNPSSSQPADQEPQNDWASIQRGLMDREAGNELPLAEADAQMRKELGFPPRSAEDAPPPPAGRRLRLDPVLAEIRRIRESYAEQFKGNVCAMMEDLRRRHAESKRPTVNRPAKRQPNPPPSTTDSGGQ